MRASETLNAIAREVLLIPTVGPRTAGALALEAIENGASLIIAAGGDGTISEVVNGMVNSQVPLGILPAGTANVLAHEIGLSRNVMSAGRQLAGCVPKRVSLGEITMASGDVRYFLMMAGAGFDARVIYHLSAGFKDKLGKASYFLAGLRRLGGTLPELNAVIDGQTRRCSFALVSKVRNYGGDFAIAAEVLLSDDRFEIVLFQGQNSWRYLQYLFGVVTKRLKHTPGVSFWRTNRIELKPVGLQPNSDAVHLQADGEYIGTLPAEIRIVPDALTLLVPELWDRRFGRKLREVQTDFSLR